MSKKSNSEILDIIQGSTGTRAYYKVSPYSGAPVATDGVIALAKAAECFWLLDLIISYRGNKKLDPEIQVWKLIVDLPNQTALVRGYNNPTELPIVSQYIPYTDFPLAEVKLYLINGVILLPSEY